MPCEERAAFIGNQAVDAMAKNDIKDVEHRHDQCMRGELNTYNSIKLSLVASMSFFLISYIFSNSLADCHENEVNAQRYWSDDTCGLMKESLVFFTFMGLITAGNILPNVFNTWRYREAKDATNAWLKEKEENFPVPKYSSVSSLSKKF